MSVRLLYDPELATYRFSGGHPLRPERFVLAVELMHAWGLVSEDRATRDTGGAVAHVQCPRIATDDELRMVHTPEYVDYVKASSRHPEGASRHGLGWGDTPAFSGMHEAAALGVGATIQAVDLVLDDEVQRAFNPAGGLHHAHADHASGFCIYNDAAVAIERATRQRNGLRVAYVDIDAHHGDGVEAAFVERPDVLTVSVHESGRYLFPGTGRSSDIGRGPGAGAAINVPLPPFAGPACYELALSEVIRPALTAFSPELLVVQGGADAHFDDPLTHLGQTVAGYVSMLEGLRELAGSVTDGRFVLLGGGGYQPYDAVPRMWAAALAVLLDRAVPELLPDAWLEAAAAAAERGDGQAPTNPHTLAESAEAPGEDLAEAALQITKAVVKEVRSASPLLNGSA